MDQEKGLTAWLVAHPWITYILIFICLVYIYNKVFRVRKLPLLKDLLIYVLIAVGAFMLLVFQIDAQLPIVLSLAVIVAAMAVLKIRYFLADRKKARRASESTQSEDKRG